MSDINTTSDRIKANEQVCILRFKPTVDNVAKVCEFVLKCSVSTKEESLQEEISKNFIDNKTTIRFCRNENNKDLRVSSLYNGYYSKKQEKYHKGKIETSWEKHRVKKLFAIDKINKFEEVYYIFELDVSKFFNEREFLYLLCYMQKLMENGKRFSVCVSKYDEEGDQKPVGDDIFFKLRHFLIGYFLLYSKQIKEGEFLCEITDKIIIYSSKGEWTRVIAKINIEETSLGRLLPAVPITKESYIVLTQNTITNCEEEEDKNTAKKLCCNIYNSYYTKIENSGKDLGRLDNYKETDNCVNSLIFISTLYYMFFDGSVKKDYNDKVLAIIHEKCSDYSQGVTQLIENALFHSVNHGGFANFSLRIRTEQDARKLYLNKPTDFLDVKYFTELYIADLQLEQPVGIKDKLIENIKGKLTNYEKEKLDKVKLEDIFEGTNPILKDFFLKAENIAYHYGLQILNNVVKTSNGCFYVVSCGDTYFSNNDTNSYNEEKILTKWEQGTLYIIILPIQLKTAISYSDTISTFDYTSSKIKSDLEPLNVSIETAESSIIIKTKIDNTEKEEKICIKENSTSEAKIEAVQTLSENNIIKIIEDKLNTSKSGCIISIDCKELNNILYEEILVKALFLVLAKIKKSKEEDENKNKAVKGIALINIVNKEKVISVFRQFAVFYDKSGNNKYMEDLYLFLVDKNAEMDILLFGNLQNIKNNMHIQQINGGLSETAMEIIKHIGNRKNEKC